MRKCFIVRHFIKWYFIQRKVTNLFYSFFIFFIHTPIICRVDWIFLLNNYNIPSELFRRSVYQDFFSFDYSSPILYKIYVNIYNFHFIIIYSIEINGLRRSILLNNNKNSLDRPVKQFCSFKYRKEKWDGFIFQIKFHDRRLYIE